MEEENDNKNPFKMGKNFDLNKKLEFKPIGALNKENNNNKSTSGFFNNYLKLNTKKNNINNYLMSGVNNNINKIKNNKDNMNLGKTFNMNNYMLKPNGVNKNFNKINNYMLKGNGNVFAKPKINNNINNPFKSQQSFGNINFNPQKFLNNNIKNPFNQQKSFGNINRFLLNKKMNISADMFSKRYIENPEAGYSATYETSADTSELDKSVPYYDSKYKKQTSGATNPFEEFDSMKTPPPPNFNKFAKGSAATETPIKETITAPFITEGATPKMLYMAPNEMPKTGFAGFKEGFKNTARKFTNFMDNKVESKIMTAGQNVVDAPSKARNFIPVAATATANAFRGTGAALGASREFMGQLYNKENVAKEIRNYGGFKAGTVGFYRGSSLGKRTPFDITVSQMGAGITGVKPISQYSPEELKVLYLSQQKANEVYNPEIEQMEAYYKLKKEYEKGRSGRSYSTGAPRGRPRLNTSEGYTYQQRPEEHILYERKSANREPVNTVDIDEKDYGKQVFNDDGTPFLLNGMPSYLGKQRKIVNSINLPHTNYDSNGRPAGIRLSEIRTKIKKVKYGTSGQPYAIDR